MIFVSEKSITLTPFKSRLITLVLCFGFLLIIESIARFTFFQIYTTHQEDFSEVMKAFFMGMRFDFRGVFITLLPTIIEVLFFFKPKKSKLRFWTISIWQYLFIFIMLFIYALDIGYFGYLQMRLNSSVLDNFENPLISLEMVWQSYPVIWSIFGLILMTSLIDYIIRKMKCRFYYLKPYTKQRFSWPAERILFLIIILPLLYGKFSYFPLRWSDSYFSTNPFINQLGLNPMLNFLESFAIKEKGYDLGSVQKYYPIAAAFLGVTDLDQNALSFERKIQALGLSNHSKTIPRSVIFIQTESLSNDKSSLSDNPTDPTPYLRMLEKESVYFTKFFTPTEATARGLFATLTGLPDVTQDKSSSRNPALVNQRILVNQLEDYEKYYFLGGSANWGNIRSLWTSNIKGIKLYEEGSYQSPRTDVWGISDLDLFKEAFQVLKKNTSKPFFAYIQTAGFHRPYTIPKGRDDFRKRSDLDEEFVKKHGFLSLEEYESLRFQDFALGKFMELIKKSPLYPNLIVFIYGDHGLPSKKSLHVPESYYKTRIVNHHVPLLIWAPGLLEPRRETHRIGSQLDLMPTMMGLLKRSYVIKTFGRDLFTPVPEEYNCAFLFSFHEKPMHASIIDSQFLLVESPTQKGIFDYQAPDYKKNVMETHPEIYKRYQDLSLALFHTATYIRYFNKN